MIAKSIGDRQADGWLDDQGERDELGLRGRPARTVQPLRAGSAIGSWFCMPVVDSEHRFPPITTLPSDSE